MKLGDPNRGNDHQLKWLLTVTVTAMENSIENMHTDVGKQRIKVIQSGFTLG